MLRDFIETGDDIITLENSMALAAYLEIDENIVLENFKDFAAKAKKKIKDFVAKVVTFISKIKNSVKTKLMTMARIDTAHIDQGVYKFLLKKWSEVDKLSSTSDISKITKRIKYSMIEKRAERDVYRAVNKGSSVGQDFELGAMREANQLLSAKLDAIKITLPDNVKNGITASYKYSSLTALQNRLDKTLTELNNDIKTLDAAANKLDDKVSIDSSAISAAIELVNIRVKKATKQSSIISAIIANSGRSNAKDKNTAARAEKGMRQ